MCIITTAQNVWRAAKNLLKNISFGVEYACMYYKWVELVSPIMRSNEFCCCCKDSKFIAKKLVSFSSFITRTIWMKFCCRLMADTFDDVNIVGIYKAFSFVSTFIKWWVISFLMIVLWFSSSAHSHSRLLEVCPSVGYADWGSTAVNAKIGNQIVRAMVPIDKFAA